MLFENLLYVKNQKGMPAGAGGLAPPFCGFEGINK
jgi:hypothetical protein